MNTDDLVERIWVEHRGRAFGVAYRLLGTVADAEDVTQDTFRQLLEADLNAVDDVAGWLVTVASRRALDRLRRHEHSRRAYVGPWLPEPLLDAPDADPADRVVLDDQVSMALLIVLDRLSVGERVCFVLHDVFGLGFPEIAGILGRTPASCRQLASRGRRRVADDPQAQRFGIDRAAHARLAERFAAACQHGDLDGLIEVLAAEVVGDFDSGGAIPGAPTEELTGARAVATQLVRSLAHAGVRCRVTTVNGEPGVGVLRNERVVAVVALTVADGRIASVHAVGNPDKLRHLQGSRR